jgi:hypothetical protein
MDHGEEEEWVLFCIRARAPSPHLHHLPLALHPALSIDRTAFSFLVLTWSFRFEGRKWLNADQVRGRFRRRSYVMTDSLAHMLHPSGILLSCVWDTVGY